MSGRVRIAHLNSHFTGIVVVRGAHPTICVSASMPVWTVVFCQSGRNGVRVLFLSEIFEW